MRANIPGVKMFLFLFIPGIVLLNNILLSVDGRLYKQNKGKQMTGQILETRHLASVTCCAVVCRSNNDCWSFNYRKNSKLCEMNGQLQEPVIIEDTNADLYSKFIVTKFIDFSK